ncbi:hypothetical protein BSU04_37095 [Caballeronia sordidicola]|uniref:Uncharacterized protein n=1 Tax=Caballeronia sordidicola TaxID=196367 RepID=A0A226WQE6_CABSO|nr:hypothetical protein BSU04_37095 [Caballeronia sordidicola]
MNASERSDNTERLAGEGVADALTRLTLKSVRCGGMVAPR